MHSHLPVVILARGGSKGIPNKNLKKIGRYNLVEWSIKCAQYSKNCNEIYLSSDSSNILDIADNFDYVKAHLRSERNSNDKARSVDALREVINSFPGLGHHKYICLLEPTFPFRSHSLIDDLYDLCLASAADSGVVIKSLQRNPKNIYVKSETGILERYVKQPSMEFSRRQDFAHICRLSSGVYICKRENIFAGDIMRGINVGISDNSRFDINIDEEQDLDYARYIFGRYQGYEDFICSACL